MRELLEIFPPIKIFFWVVASTMLASFSLLTALATTALFINIFKIESVFIFNVVALISALLVLKLTVSKISQVWLGYVRSPMTHFYLLFLSWVVLQPDAWYIFSFLLIYSASWAELTALVWHRRHP